MGPASPWQRGGSLGSHPWRHGVGSLGPMVRGGIGLLRFHVLGL